MYTRVCECGLYENVWVRACVRACVSAGVRECVWSLYMCENVSV